MSDTNELTATQLLQTTDAKVWAEEFVRLHGGDVGLMIGWFANAMAAQEMKDSRRASET